MVSFIPTALSSLPKIASLQDCADYSKTLAPFLPQLYRLPYDIANAFGNVESLKNVYLLTNPAVTGLAISIALGPVFLVVSEVTRNYSQVDRVWSLLPLMYNAHFALWAHLSGIPTQRLDNVLAFSAVWSLRLTYNYWRKGGYSWGSEDYRWAIIKDYLGEPIMFVLNVVFIATIQSLLLYAITLPTYVLLLASRVTGPEMTTADIVFARVLMGLILVEWFADQQQWNYQQAKKEYRSTAKVPSKFDREDLDRGFVVSGLWSYSRHPNFAAEQTIWVVLYQWSCYATNTLYNWTIFGAIPLLLVFQGSTWLTERITASKYPEYKEYQAKVGKFLPKPSSLFADGAHVPAAAGSTSSTSKSVKKN